MKKTLFPALAAALVLAACGTKTTGQAEVAAEAAAQQVVSSDIAYVLRCRWAGTETVQGFSELFLTGRYSDIPVIMNTAFLVT